MAVVADKPLVGKINYSRYFYYLVLFVVVVYALRKC